LNSGYRIIAFDAPSHGGSSIGKTNMFEFADFLVDQFQNYQPKVVISHSFGSVNVAKVLRQIPELKVKLWVMITTPFDFKSRIDQMVDFFKLKKKVRKNLVNKIEEDTNERIENLNMATYCREICNVEKGLIVHSKEDNVLPIEGARKVNEAFAQSEMVELEDYGHYSILWSKELKQILAEQLGKQKQVNQYF